jgi:hypothetical protein
VPVTLPAHAAAVLPLLRVRRPWVIPSALVLGACAPDLVYVLRVRSIDAHTLPGLFLFCLPMGLAMFVWLEGLVLPVLRRTLPPVGGVQWARFLRTDGLPRTARPWAYVALCLLLGAATHILWDGFTHRRLWPASVLYPDVLVPVGRRVFPLARVFQHLSSLVGSVVVLAFMARRYPGLPPAPGGSWRAFLPVLVPTLVGAVALLGLRLSRWQNLGSLEGQLWWLFWPTVTGALLGLTVGCLLAWRKAPL